MSEVIQNKEKNSFVEKLKKMVIRENKDIVKNNSDYEQYIEQEIEKMLKERGKFVAVTSPEEEKKFRAEARRSISAALVAKEAEDKANKKDDEKSAEEKKEEIADKIGQAKVEKANTVRDINSKQIGYLDRVELLYQMKMKMLREQLKKDEYVPSDKEYYKMLLLQKSIESDREEYLAGLDEKTRAQVVKVEEEYKGKELDIERRSNQKFRQELDEFAKLNIKMREINEWIEQKQQEMREGKVDPEEYEKAMQEKQLELEDTLEKISALNPQKLQEVCDTKTKHARLERGIMGKDYRARVYERSSDEMRERLDYKTRKEKLQDAVTNKENRFFEQNGIDRTIEEYKKHKEELEKELEKINENENIPENIKRKAEVLKELMILDARLDGAENKKEDLEQGMKYDENVEAKLVTEERSVAEDIKEIEQDFTEIEKNIEEMDKDVETAGIQGKTEQEIRKEAITTGAVVGGTVAIAGGSTTEAVVAGVFATEIKEQDERKAQGKIGEWEGMVNDTPDEKAVENFRETQEAMQEQQELYEQERIRK